MTKIIKLLLFIYALIFSMSSLSNSYSAEYQSIVKSSGEDVPSLLKKALNQTILKVLGSKREFNLNEKKIRELETEKYIKEYQLYFEKNNTKVWGLQYHPEITYEKMISLIEFRKKRLIEYRKVFKNDDEVEEHISFIKKEILLTDKENRMLELKNWLTKLD